MKDINIIIGQGFDKIQFGMPQEIVEETLGLPNTVHIENYKQDDQYERWEYIDQRVNLFFYDDGGNVLEGIESENEQTLLCGHRVIGMEIDEFEKIKSQLDLDDLEKDEDNENYSSVDKSINIWYADDVIESIQWGYLYDNNDEPIFPYSN